MTPQTYRATLRRLNLTHKEAASLLAIHHATSLKSNVNETTARLLRCIEAIGVDEARRILETRK